MKNQLLIIKNKIISRYLFESEKEISIKTADINVLLNRVKNEKKNQSKKKLFFSAITSLGLALFCFSIF
jgi:hypothetical protein